MLTSPGATASLKPHVASAAESSPWFDTNSNAAQSRANLSEQVLTPSAVPKVKYLRSVVSPLVTPTASCPGPVAAPVLDGGYLYVITDEQLSKYDAATGELIWRSTPDPTFSAWDSVSLAVSGNFVVVGAIGCESESEPGGQVYAFNSNTGALDWESQALGSATINQAVMEGYAKLSLKKYSPMAARNEDRNVLSGLL
jgi:PQQ-like domain